MQLQEAIKVLKNGEFWKSLPETTPKKDMQDLCDAVDVAVMCMEGLSRLTSALASETTETESRSRRIVTGGEDCADCLCRVCARNTGNDCSNSKLDCGCADCEPCNHCRVGETELVEIEDDCPRQAYLPDECI